MIINQNPARVNPKRAKKHKCFKDKRDVGTIQIVPGHCLKPVLCFQSKPFLGSQG